MALKVNTDVVTAKIPYIVDGKKVATFEVQIPTPEQLDAIMKKHTKVEWDSPTKRAQKERFKESDYLAIAKERFCLIVIGWKDVTDMDGKVLECNEESKLAIFRHNREVVEFINDEIDEIMGFEKEEEEDKTKNS